MLSEASAYKDQLAASAVRQPIVPAGAELSHALRACKFGLVGVGVFTIIINILVLTGALYMLQVYDRVIPSRSISTLVALSLIAAFMYLFHGFFEAVRSRMLTRIGGSLDEAVSRRVFDVIVTLPLMTRQESDGLQPLRDLDQLRSFLSSNGPAALFDLPWIPVYLAICFLFHPAIGATATLGALVLIGLAIATEMATREPIKSATQHVVSRNSLAEAGRRNAEALRAMGMASRIRNIWGRSNDAYLASQARASDVASGLGAASRVLRLMLQSGVLAVGAYLVVNQLASGGIMIAGSILVARALAPVELSIANWKGFIGARLSWRRLTDLLKALPAQEERHPLPAPRNVVSVEGLGVCAPGERRLLVESASFALQSGAGLGVVGNSGSGKSSLVRALVGVWPTAVGKVRLDGAALDQWHPDRLGKHIGYLPQDVELLAGTLAQNISRFDPNPDPDAIIAAAKDADVHNLILTFPNGYDTVLGDSGRGLSGGQKQRVALARALYGDPFLLVLDEPNANLDSAGEHALTDAILRVRGRGGIVVVVAHRAAALSGVDQLIVMDKGRIVAAGAKEAVLRQLAGPSNVTPTSPPPPELPGREGSL
jgi:ATP-binding cassette subfamily C protein